MIDSLLNSINKESDDLKLKELKISERKLELNGIVAALNHVKPHVAELERKLTAANERISELEAQLAEAQARLSAPIAAKGD